MRVSLPLEVDGEELGYDRRRRGVRVELADTGREERPGDTTREAEDVRVDASPLGPQPNGTKRSTERVDVRDEVEDHVSDARAW